MSFRTVHRIPATPLENCRSRTSPELVAELAARPELKVADSLITDYPGMMRKAVPFGPYERLFGGRIQDGEPGRKLNQKAPVEQDPDFTFDYDLGERVLVDHPAMHPGVFPFAQRGVVIEFRLTDEGRQEFFVLYSGGSCRRGDWIDARLLTPDREYYDAEGI